MLLCRFVCELSATHFKQRLSEASQRAVCKRDDDIAGSVEYWEQQIREFEERGGKPFEEQERITGIIGINPRSSKIKEHLDIVEDKLLT